MAGSPVVRLAALVCTGAMSLPLLAGSGSASAAIPRVPSIGKQLAELKGTNVFGGGWFGTSVAVSGATAVVGATHTPFTEVANYSGRAFVFERAATGWIRAAELKGSDTAPGDFFGSSVAVSAKIALVGAPYHAKGAGRAYVFVGTANGWTQAAELKDPDTATGPKSSENFGWSVAVAGTTAVVGAPLQAKGAGRAYVFTKTATGWKQAAVLKGGDSAAGDEFGSSVAVAGTTAVVGAPFHAGDAGMAYVFAKTRTGWTETSELSVSGIAAGYEFGSAVAVSGGTALVGAGHASGGGLGYVFAKTQTGWAEAAELKGVDTVSGDEFGSSVAVSGTKALVGAWAHAHFQFAGRAYLFSKTAAGWREVAELKGTDTGANDYFGISVGLSGTNAVVGAYGHDKHAGRAYVFTA